MKSHCGKTGGEALLGVRFCWGRGSAGGSCCNVVKAISAVEEQYSCESGSGGGGGNVSAPQLQRGHCTSVAKLIRSPSRQGCDEELLPRGRRGPDGL